MEASYLGTPCGRERGLEDRPRDIDRVAVGVRPTGAQVPLVDEGAVHRHVDHEPRGLSVAVGVCGIEGGRQERRSDQDTGE